MGSQGEGQLLEGTYAEGFIDDEFLRGIALDIEAIHQQFGIGESTPLPEGAGSGGGGESSSVKKVQGEELLDDMYQQGSGARNDVNLGKSLKDGLDPLIRTDDRGEDEGIVPPPARKQALRAKMLEVHW